MDNENSVINNEETVSEDLYAPFGDKTFTPDNNVNTENNSVENQEINDNLENTTTDSNNEEEKDYYATNGINIDGLSDYLDNLNNKNKDEEDDPNIEYEVDDKKLLLAYISKNQKKFFKNKFNVPAFFFGPLYLIYRKMYKKGILLGILVALLTSLITAFLQYMGSDINIIVLAICAVLLIIDIIIYISLGFKTNKDYLDLAYKNTMKIKKENHKSEEKLIEICSVVGGTTIGKLILSLFLFAIISSAFSLASPIVIKNLDKNLSLNIKEYEEDTKDNNILDEPIIDNNVSSFNINYNTDVKAYNLIILNVPTGYETNITDEYSIDYINTSLSTNFTIKVVNNYELNGIVKQITNVKDFINDYATYSKQTLSEVVVGNNTWYTFNSNNTYYAATKNKNYVYLYEYNIENENSLAQALDDYTKILNNIKFK